MYIYIYIYTRPSEGAAIEMPLRHGDAVLFQQLQLLRAVFPCGV